MTNRLDRLEAAGLVRTARPSRPSRRPLELTERARRSGWRPPRPGRQREPDRGGADRAREGAAEHAASAADARVRAPRRRRKKKPRIGSVAGPIDPGVDIGHVHLKVADLDRAIAFYRTCSASSSSSAWATRPRSSRPAVPPPHRAQHMGDEGRLAAGAGDDRTLPLRHPLSDAGRARECAQRLIDNQVPTRRVGPRRQRGDLPQRSGRKRDRAVLRSPAGGMASAAEGDGVAMGAQPLDLRGTDRRN